MSASDTIKRNRAIERLKSLIQERFETGRAFADYGWLHVHQVIDQWAESHLQWVESDEVREIRAECDRLSKELNTPHTLDFIEAVRVEAAHQRDRWGRPHDAGKRPEDWIALVIYLLGKATKAHYDGDTNKLLHHVITLAAVAANWHANLTGFDMRMRPGVAS